MSDAASDAALVPVKHDMVSLLKGAGVPEIITEMMSLYVALAEKMRKQGLTYLDLPPVLAPVALAPWYHDALCMGRGLYFDSLHEYDEATDSLVRVPDPYTRQEIREFVLAVLSLEDLQVAVFVPLSWRVGVVVGWLSGLSISQRDDAQASMVMLAALAAPLLVPQRVGLGVSAGSAKVLRSGKSKKSSRRKSGRK